MSVREKRLQNDLLALSELVDKSIGGLKIISKKGNPPFEYVIEYNCRGVEKLQVNEPIYRNNHRIQIALGNSYPQEKPDVKFLTPIFHPNVWENLTICLGNYWTMAETVPELVIRVGKIIQYSKDVLNLNSPANGSAKNWAQKNMSRFPVDTQTFKSLIEWDNLV